MSLILGVNLSHNRSACLLKDGRILVAIEEERLDRRKYSPGFIFSGTLERFERVCPMKAITYCLDAADVGIDDVDLVVGSKAIEDYSLDLLQRELPIRDKRKITSLPNPSHHLAHAYSTYFCSPFEESAILIADGWGSSLPGGEGTESESMFLGKGNKIYSISSRIRGPKEFSLGLFYDFFSGQLGFHLPFIDERFGVFGDGFAEPGKTMALAALGRHREEYDRLIEHDDGRVSIRWKELQESFLSWQAMEGSTLGKTEDKPLYDCAFGQDIAFKAQEELEEALVYLANHLFQKTRSKNLCLAGGVALNVCANTKILENTPFENIFIQPAANDAGNAIGAAYYGYYEVLGGKGRFPLDSAYLGRQYSASEIESALQHAMGIVYERSDNSKVARLLAEGKLIAWFQGGSEFGPRALGHRSILADPRDIKNKEILNKKVKQREHFRPYAPSVLLEFVSDFFEFSGSSPFMLMTAQVKRDKRAIIPAVTHVDGSARIQTVDRQTDPRFYDLIKQFYVQTGIPMILNTSFNLRGEPIVESPSDALNCFNRSGLDYLVLSDYLVSKRG